MAVLHESVDTLLVNCHAATMAKGRMSVIRNAGIAVKNSKIVWVGAEKDLDDIDKCRTVRRVDCGRQWVLPGFVDCHTHLVWGGSRSNEFEMRLNGATYEQISQKGGGIASTVKATRNASEQTLFESAAKRVAHFIKNGITTVEIKSGYGLDLDTELKMLSVIRRLDRQFPIHIEATFLGAHTFPKEYKDKPERYVDLLIEQMIPKVKNQGIASAVDVFCERIAFSPDQTRRIFEKAVKSGFNVKLHAEQLSDCDGAALAADFRALSCDHLEYLSEKGTAAMARNNVTAVLLPGAFYYLNETRKPPVQMLRDYKVPMALATDLNPGSSPVHAMTTILNMACLLFGLTVEEAIAGATLNGARALKLDHCKGSIEAGKDADLAVWDIERPADLCYLTGILQPSMVITKGRNVFNRLDLSP